MSDAFMPVTRKKWMCRKSLQRKKYHQRELNTQLNVPVDIDAFLKRLTKLCQRMATSDYFLQSVETLDKSFNVLGTNSEKLQRLVCFGIGAFTQFKVALHQFAFILCMQRHYELEEAIYFDPIHSEAEKEILERLQCAEMKENTSGAYEVDTPTLFYLPHCPSALTNNLLYSNWRPNRLKNVILINNSFANLVCDTPERLLRVKCFYILEGSNWGKELVLDDDYEIKNIFNDLSVHVFPLIEIPPEGNECWTTRASIYEDDSELITNNFVNLKISI